MGFGTMYVGASGMIAQSEWMQGIGNNLANVNTIGYKGTQTFFETLMSESLATGYSYQGGTTALGGQIGKGVAVADFRTDFSDGSFEEGTANTDLAITGNGFFKLRDADGGEAYYSRAGNFRFDKNGVLVDPHGYALQGIPLASSLSGTDVRLPGETVLIDGQEALVVKSDPQATSQVSMVANLDSSEEDHTSDPGNPFFALGQAWDGASSTPLDSSQYAYESEIKIWDENGESHAYTVYFDRVDLPAEQNDGNIYWEYVVGIDPAEDGRDGFTGTSAAGLLMMGSLAFNDHGELLGQTAYSLEAGATDVKNLSNWTLTSMDADGRPVVDVSFLQASGGSSVSQPISLDFGITSGNGTWDASEGATAASVGVDPLHLPRMNEVAISALAATSYDSSSVTLDQSQDGYGEGYLTDVTISLDGILTGVFSNGQYEDLWRIDLYNFANEFGLRREGGNLFSANPAAGSVSHGAPGTEGLGSIYDNALETSNVDMTTEFANMILAQRGFQANSKVITTTDQLLTTTIQAKR